MIQPGGEGWTLSGPRAAGSAALSPRGGTGRHPSHGPARGGPLADRGSGPSRPRAAWVPGSATRPRNDVIQEPHTNAAVSYPSSEIKKRPKPLSRKTALLLLYSACANVRPSRRHCQLDPFLVMVHVRSAAAWPGRRIGRCPRPARMPLPPSAAGLELPPEHLFRALQGRLATRRRTRPRLVA